MQYTTFRALFHARIPHLFTSTSPSPQAAQKKSYEALGAASATAVRAGEYARSALGHSAPDSLVFLAYNLAVAREVLKHVYTAERLQLPTSSGTVFGTYGTLWGCARSLGYWREVVWSGEYARVGVYALEAYGIFKVREIVGRRSPVGYNGGVELGACAIIP